MLSRVAESLFWMSRYLERAEDVARIIAVNFQASLDAPSASQALAWEPLIAITGDRALYTAAFGGYTAEQITRFLTIHPENPNAIRSCIGRARENARAVRGAITSEMWEVLNATWLEMQQMDEAKMEARGISNFFDWVKERSHLFRGVTFGTLHRDDAYDFSRLGTHMERADSTARILDVKYHILLPSVTDVGGAVDYYQWSAVLRSVSAFEAYRKVYRDVITPLKLAELLMLRDDIPRSLHFCLKQVYDTLSHVQNNQSADAMRRAGRILAGLQYGRISEIFQGGLHEYLTRFLDDMHHLSQDVQRAFFAATLVE